MTTNNALREARDCANYEARAKRRYAESTVPPSPKQIANAARADAPKIAALVTEDK